MIIVRMYEVIVIDSLLTINADINRAILCLAQWQLLYPLPPQHEMEGSSLFHYC